MPIFFKPSEPPIFFAHVPKTGGTYIEDLFVRNGYERVLWDKRYRGLGLVVSPRHLHRELYAPLVRPDAFKLAFMSVRHPVDRLMSEYRHHMERSAHQPLLEWLAQAEAEFERNPHHLDNHLRPQADFRDDGLLVFRQEERFDAEWARRLSEEHGLGFTEFEVRQRRNTIVKQAPLLPGEAEALLAFCHRHYAEDFAAFGYDPEAARILRLPAAPPAPPPAEKPPEKDAAAPRSLGRRLERKARLARRRALEHLNDLLGRAPRPLVLDDALIAPLRYIPGQDRNPESLRAQAGLYDSRGRFVHGAALVRNGRELDRPGRFEQQSGVQRTVLYAGRLFDHFGHFLLEGLSRLWCADAFPDAAIAWSVPEGSRPEGLRPWQRDLLDRMVGPREHVLVDAPTRFARVVLAEPGFVIPDRFAPWHRQALERAGMDYRPEPGRRTWLSRRGHDGDEGLLNGASLETHLARAGWDVLRPETLAVGDQIAAFARSGQVAGEEGSALHLAILLRDARALRLDILARRVEAEAVKPAYATIARGKGFRHRAHSAPDEIVLRTHRVQATRVARHFRGHLEALDVPVIEGPAAEPPPWAAEVEALRARLPAGARALQLGGRVGSGLSARSGQTTVLVSDDIGADPRSRAAAGYELIETTPELCLELDLLGGRSFDLVLVADRAADLPEAALRSLAGPDGVILRIRADGGLAS